MYRKDIETKLNLELFPYCNLSCKFCFERNRSEYKGVVPQFTPIEYIKKAKEAFLKLPKDKQSVDLLSIWGGEVWFFDSDEYNAALEDLIVTINPKKYLHTNTNLTYINKTLQKILNCEFNFKLELDLSYDPINRYPNKEIENIVLTNIERVKQSKYFIQNQERFNIEVVLQDEVVMQTCDLTVLDKLYSDPTNVILFNELENPVMPKDLRENYGKYLIELYKRYPNCSNVLAMRQKGNNKFCYCFYDNFVFLSYLNMFSYTETVGTCAEPFVGRNDAIKSFYERYNCNECKYNQYCSGVCISALRKSKLIEYPCFYKYVFENLDSIKPKEILQKKSFQWELWANCNSKCKFCCLDNLNSQYDRNRQLKSLNDLDKAINDLNFSIYNNISLIGGEFFQGQLNDIDIHDKFFKIVKKIFHLYITRRISSIWITCTLTLGGQRHLYELLKLAEDMGVPLIKSDGLWLCTSWDAKGRFHNESMETNWKRHMHKIKEKFPWIKFNTTIILQQAFIDLYNSGRFKPKEFMKEYNTSIFYKQPDLPFTLLNGIEKYKELGKEKYSEYWLNEKQRFNKEKYEFFPTRKSFIKFLMNYYKDDRDTFDKLFNIKYRSDELHLNLNNIENDISIKRDKSRLLPEDNFTPVLECGHVYNYACYSDSNKCCLCDKNIILDGGL